MSDLRLSNINKTYPGGVQAIYDFNMQIKHGEFVVLVGPSGCGKTTILRMIAGLEQITSGDMYLAERHINNIAPADRDISMVFQDYALYGHMSVYQNMGLSQIIRHEDADVIHEKVMKAADIVELQGQLNRFPRHLSGGQRQRVALGRSIVSFASIILMDEPLCNLDAKLRVQARRELIKLHQQLGNTFIYVTHDQTEALTMADRIVIMNGGRIQQVGTPYEVYQMPENLFVAGFIGSPSMNFFRGHIKNGRFIAPALNLRIPPSLLTSLRDLCNENVILGVRPECFSTVPNEFSEGIQAKVVVSEFLGDRSLVYLKVADTEHVASLKENLAHCIDQTLHFYIDMNRAHFFDSVSEKRIRREGDKS